MKLNNIIKVKNNTNWSGKFMALLCCYQAVAFWRSSKLRCLSFSRNVASRLAEPIVVTSSRVNKRCLSVYRPTGWVYFSITLDDYYSFLSNLELVNWLHCQSISWVLHATTTFFHFFLFKCLWMLFLV